MINLRTLSYLTNTELLRMLDERRENSPIISELCNRLQTLDEEVKIIVEVKDSVDCPVCLAPLKSSIDQDKKIFVLEIIKK